MRIAGIELDAVHVNHRGDWLFVHVLTDEGLRGIGEMRTGKDYGKQLAALRSLGDWLVGRDPTQIESIVSEWPGDRTDKFDTFALSAVEPALWDILGKSLKVPVYALFGGRVRDEIRLYANINRATTDRRPEGFAANAKAAVDQGFDAVKLAPFDGLPHNVDSAREARDGIACMEAVRAAIGPDVDLLIDCHSHFTVKGSLEVADALRGLDLFWFEQPTPESNTQACLEVKAKAGMTIAGGEQRAFREMWREVMSERTMDIIMPDVTVTGGMAELRKIADMAAAWDIPTAPHGPFGPVVLASHVHAMAGFPGFTILEYGWGEIPWRADLTEPREEIVNGRVKLSDRPGLGLTLNRDVVDAHRVRLD